jgi:hypothetical protein
MKTARITGARLKSVLMAGGIAVFLALAMILSSCSTLTHPQKVTTVVGEFWIGTNTASGNLGTSDNPFVCVTETQFDRTMSNLPPNCTVHILAGTYSTRGSPAAYSVKTGQKVIGSGMDVTVLKLVPGTPDNTSVMGSSFGTNMEVSDLTCDGNYPGQNGSAVTLHGITLLGSRNAIRRVKVINLAKYGGNSEAWGIVLDSGGVEDSTANVIEDCEVSDFQGGLPGQGISAFSLNGTPKHSISGVVTHNRVSLQPEVYHPVVAFNNAYTSNCVYQENYVDGATFGFYGDTGRSLNVLVARNTFKNVIEGVSLANARRLNVTFSQNKILLATNKVSVEIAFNVQETWVTNLIVIGNVVAWNTAPPDGSLGCFLNLSDVSGLRVTDNQVEGTLTNHFWNDIVATAFISTNNLDLNGRPYLIQLPGKPEIDKSTEIR